MLRLVQPLAEARPHLLGRQLRPLALVTRDDDPGGGHAGQPRDPEHLPQLHRQDSFHAPTASLTLDEAVDLTRTGDLWLFRGRSAADHAIRVVTNAPVNHVGMAVVLDDLPPLMWHAELGKGLRDVWTGSHHRGVQLHDLREAVDQWTGRYEQHAWLRQLDAEVTPEMEAAVLKTIARLDGTAVPGDRRAGRPLGAGPGTPHRRRPR